MLRALTVTSQLLLALLLYPVVAVLSFWPFGDDGVTLAAVLTAAVLNLAFGLAFRWPAIVLPAVLFPVWHFSMPDSCQNCDAILDAGMYSLGFTAIGALARHVAVERRLSATD